MKRTDLAAPSIIDPATKMLVRDDRGFKVWGTLPNALKAGRGDQVAFCAKVQRSDKDATFGFFSRPTKARKLEAAVSA